MASTITHQTEGTEYATRAEFDALREELRLVLAGAERFFEAGVEFGRRSSSPSRARSGLRLVAAEGERLILKVARS